jgi:Putative zinc-binding metallo-peptidase
MPTGEFAASHKDWLSVPIGKLGLSISGSALEPILADFAAELERVGIRRLKPVFYLSTEWGVPFGTVAIAIPFYLVRPELAKLQAERAGFVEGFNRADFLRYLRHEMGHVINYAYMLYERDEWTRLFGSINTEYVEEYKPQPFSRNFVNHLPGWYAQKHPDEDWAETFAVWMTPGLDYEAEYASWPVALEKLWYCDRTMAELKDREPLVTAKDLDEDVSQLAHSLEDFYGTGAATPADLPPGLEGALRTIFEDAAHPEDGAAGARQPASGLIQSLEPEIVADVYRWTGNFPERTRQLLRHLAKRADDLKLVYAESQQTRAVIGLTTVVTALAMDHVYTV